MSLSRIDHSKAHQGYRPVARSGETCQRCLHAAARTGGQLNCNKGGFWVARGGGCRQFETRPEREGN